MVGHFVDGNAYPRLASSLALSWMPGDYRLDWTTRYRHGIQEACAFGPSIIAGHPDSVGFNPCSHPDANSATFPSGYHQQGGTTQHDVRLTWTTPWQGRIGVGIDNAFDKNPPVSLLAAAHSFDTRAWDVPGRFWYVQYRQHW